MATIAYAPLLIITASSRPWQKKYGLFVLFLIAAMVWSLIDYFARSGLFPNIEIYFVKAVIIAFPVMAVQFHLFTSYFFTREYKRWLPFAYGSLAMIIVLVALGFIPKDIVSIGDRLHPVYGVWIVLVAIPLLTISIRNIYVFWKIIKTTNNPLIYNQAITLMIGISVLTVSMIVSILPKGTEYAIGHFGNLFNAVVLSYAVLRHQLVDIKLVLRKSTAWVSLMLIGALSFWLLLVITEHIFSFELDLVASLVATVIALIVAVFIYRIRSYFFEIMSRALQGSIYNYRRQLTDFTSKIHNVFSLKERAASS